ncbi:MAG: HEPN domain-containing protein [Nanoarchaeota archaeon]|nr:HEPN domain-containing protein [Nanoarchaeota archaeon]
MNSRKQSDKWVKIEKDDNLVSNALKLAERDIKTATDVYNNRDYDWAFSIAYNAMLQAGRSLMFSEGYRPIGEAKHVSVIEFVKTKFGKEFAEKILFLFNKIRKKRHVAVYEQVNIISEEEAKNALNTAKEFHKKVKEIIITPF